MAASTFGTHQFTSSHFVESAGAIAFRLSARQVCLVYLVKKNEWVFAKGRRNVGESRRTTAIREVEEETGYKCHLLPLTMATRSPPAVETRHHYPDNPRVHRGVCEPFMVSLRELSGGSSLKLIWWYIATIDEDKNNGGPGPGEDQFKAELVTCERALELLTFETDRDVLRRAMEILEANMWTRDGIGGGEKEDGLL